MYKKIKRDTHNETNRDMPITLVDWIITLAGIGICLTSPIGAKKITSAIRNELLKKLFDNPKEISSHNLSQALYRLKQRKIIKIEFDETTNQHRITLTEKGKKYKMEYDAENCRIAKPAAWDGKWRLLMFDIPENQRKHRQKLRRKLIELGFILFQKSIWVFPYPCEKEINFFAELFDIAPHITILTVSIENDQPLRKEFNLLSPL